MFIIPPLVNPYKSVVKNVRLGLVAYVFGSAGLLESYSLKAL